ncbi:hypothetical protein GCM10010218_15740 [Streptomyces mashuensis]|uniref:RHS repeat-associated protein n=1 Tax=Streptomyces mashuensis TaxID=33904 RepID=A0A919EBS8_9ACTN|nr:DUF6531 domain-containing protein [Streptomyces mashuensis]GHF35358.1 hypothetical protein GCM10010218_15740 [Streptomyces mashuensis]
MSAAAEAKKILRHLGLQWPDGDPKKLRKAAKAWRTFATSVEEVRGPVDKAAQTLIHHNKGEAIDAFDVFWSRYVGRGDKGWLVDLPKAAKAMADALDNLAHAIEDAVHKLEARIAIDAVVIVAGIGLAAATFGASTLASAAAATAIIELGASLGIGISALVAETIAATFVMAAFGGVEAVTIDAALAQPMKIAAGLQDGFSLDEINESAKSGMIVGGAFGGYGPLLNRAGGARGVPDVLRGIRPNLVELPSSARPTSSLKCAKDPIDVATGVMVLPQTDLTLPGDLPLVLERTHLSSYRAGGWFGPSWASTLDERIQLDTEGVVFAAADGMRLVYPVPKPGEPVHPVKGPRWPLQWDGRPDGAMTVTDPARGTVRTFSGPLPTDTPGAVQLPLQTVHDRNGAQFAIERTALGVPTAVTHSGGYHVAIDTEGPRITALRLLDEPPSPYERQEAPLAGTTLVRYGYDDAGHLAEVVNSSGRPLRFTYDAEGRITSWTDRNGTSYGYVYDEHGRVVRTEGSEGFLSGTLVYDDHDDASRTTTETDSLGHLRTYRSNAGGRVVAETDQLGHTTLTEWDDRGENPLAVTDPLGRTTRYTYDDAGRLVRVTLPDGTTGEAAYGTHGRPLRVTEPGGTVWQHTYDDRGNLLTTTDPAGAVTRYAYDERGRLMAVTDALGHVTGVRCDEAGLPVRVTDPLGHATTARRDAFGRIVEVTDPLGHVTRTEWTPEGRPSRRTYPDGTAETWTWDGEGNLTAHTDRAGHTTAYTHTHFDLLASRTEPDGARYTFAYDTELRLTGVTNPQGLTWSYVYDEAGRLTAETDFDGRTLTYAHNAAGELVERTNGAGETLRFERDVLGRVVAQRVPGDEAATTTYAYDAAGSLARTANAAAEVLYERDALGRPLTETVAGRTTSYAYDALGRVVRRRTPSGLTSEWTYDAAGRATELRSEAGTLAFAYDAAGRETTRRLGEGVTLTQAWDASDRLKTQVVAAAETILQHRAYAYREDGHLTEIRELTSGTRRFTLDPAGRATAVSAHGWTETYAYDTTGNLTQVTAPAHGSPGSRTFEGTLLRRAGRTTYEHDAQGRLVRKVRKLLNGQKREWTYVWDAEDRLREAVTPDGERWQYAYDPLGRRVSKRRASDGATVFFTWDGTRLAEQSTPDGTATTWDYAPGTHRPLTQTDHRPLIREAGKSLIDQLTKDAAPRFHAIVTDLVGTPTELITPDGTLSWQHRTTLWGTDLPSPPAGAVDCPLRFPGQYADPETGLHYNYFRYYDPETARYLSPDPLGLDPAPNPVGFVRNPYDCSDPLGLSPCEPGEILGDTSRLNGWIPTEVPEESQAVLRDIREFGVEAQGAGPQRQGPSLPQPFSNTGKNGAYQLPTHDSTGKPITYLEWGTVQSAGNPKWGGERIVTGSDGSAYYTPTHYQTYIVMEAPKK